MSDQLVSVCYMYGSGFKRHPLEKGKELLVQPRLGRFEKGACVLIIAGQPGLYSVLHRDGVGDVCL